MTFLSWAVRCFLWTSILHSSYHVIQDHFSPMSFPRRCACPDKDGKMYNLESLGSKDKKHPRFSANSTTYRGYAYSYNPCWAFHLGPTNSSCQKNVAICWWVLNLTQSAYTYNAIGIQRGAHCGLDDDQDNTPVIVYQASGEFPNRTSIVRLTCAEGKKDTATFKVHDEDKWIFQLTYSWEACPTMSTQGPESSSSVPVVAAGAVGAVCAVFGLTFLIYAVSYCKKKRNGNDNTPEREPILGNAEGDQQPNVIHNPIVGLNPSHAKPDVNVIRSAHP